MKKIAIVLMLLMFSVIPTFAKSKVEILKVYDGDTVLARIDDNTFRIRLIGIDCFEGTTSDRAKKKKKKYNMTLIEVVSYGNFAGDILKGKLNNKEAYFSFKGIDKYNRALGILYVDGVNINEELLKTPYCKVYSNKN